MRKWLCFLWLAVGLGVSIRAGPADAAKTISLDSYGLSLGSIFSVLKSQGVVFEVSPEVDLETPVWLLCGRINLSEALARVCETVGLVCETSPEGVTLVSAPPPVTGTAGKDAAAGAAAGRAALHRGYEPWQQELDKPDEEGFPPDRRLLATVSIWQPHLTIGEALAEAQKQTGVKLSAFEPELQGQKITLFAKDLPLDALMVQLAKLLGLYWYYRTESGIREYVVTYGSGLPILKGEKALAEKQAYWRNARASRIADAIRAAEFSEAELRELAKTDPSLAGQMLTSIASRYAAKALAGMPPEALRKLIDTGTVTVGGDELPSWFAEGLRREFKPRPHLGISSPDMMVKQARLRFNSPEHILGPEDALLYDISGPIWPGVVCQQMLVPVSESGHESDPVASNGFLFLPGEVGSGVLPGRMDDMERAKKLYPALSDKKWGNESWEAWRELVLESTRRRRSEVSESAWKEDPRLSQPPDATVMQQMRSTSRVTDLLGAVANQTGYAFVGTYYDDHDARPSGDAPMEVVEKEPLYVLLNSTALVSKCSWTLAGRLIRWRHDNWFVFEAASTKKAQSVPIRLPAGEG